MKAFKLLGLIGILTLALVGCGQSGETVSKAQFDQTVAQVKTLSGNNTRTFIGTYNLGLIKEEGQWKVNQFAFNLKIMV